MDRVLVTGAAGGIGRMIRPLLRGVYPSIRLSDIVEIYTEDPYGAKNPPEAVKIMDELRAKYPESAMVHSAHMVALYVAERYEDSVKDSLDFLAHVAKGKYNSLEEAKGRVILGTARR